MEEFLFKVPLSQIFDGTLTIDWPWSRFLIAVLVIAVLVYLVGGFLSVGRLSDNLKSFSTRAIVNWLIRTALLSLLLFVFLDPTLRVTSPEPAPARLAVVLDNSLSMGIRDGNGNTTRGEQLLREFDPQSGDTSNALKERFEVEHYKYAISTERLKEQDTLNFDGVSSNSADALADFASKGIATVLLVSDGDNSGTELDQTLNALIAAGVRVFTVGVGQEKFDNDIDIVGIDVPNSVLTDDTIIAEVELKHRGDADENLNLVIEQDGVILKEHTVEIDADSGHTHASIPLTFDSPGPRQLSFRVTGNESELIKANNSIERSINVTDSRYRVLHFEGEPRFEVKFVRRALTDDVNLQLTSLIRTADNKFFRVGLQDQDELADGFPVERSELYRFDAVVLGSVDRSLMTDQQLELLRDFVAIRGGGLLSLGGSGAYAEGGYADSVLADLLPVEFDNKLKKTLAHVSVTPSSMGRHSTLLADVPDIEPVPDDPQSSDQADSDTDEQSDEENAPTAVSMSVNDRWQRLPKLTIVNPILRAKTGATVLLEGVDEGLDRYVVMAKHRYGHGTVIALPVRDTWRWQIHATVTPQDTTHESLWRRMLRSLVTNARQQISIQASKSTGVIGETLQVTIETRDQNFVSSSPGKELELRVTSPSGVVETLKASAVAGETGFFRAAVSAREVGRYDFRVVDDTSDESTENANPRSMRVAQTHIDVSRDGDEFRDAERNTAMLKHIAERTGAGYFDIDNLGSLVDDVDAIQPVRQVTRKISLADAPFFLGLILLLFVAELLLRRRWRFA